MKIVLDLPECPSANSIWRSGKSKKSGKSFVYASKKYKAWLAEAHWHWICQRPVRFERIEGAYEIKVIVFPTRKGRDLDNYWKALNDGLQKFGIIANDKNAVSATIRLGTAEEAPAGMRVVLYA